MSILQLLYSCNRGKLINQILAENFPKKNLTKFIQELMYLGFYYSHTISLSLNLEDTKSYFYIKYLIQHRTLTKVPFNLNYENKSIILSKPIFQLFFNLITTYKILNPISNNLHIISTSGSRSTWEQLLQLFGMRGILTNTKGIKLDIPILSSFGKGLKIHEYLLSCYGSRKGILDTAVKTADAGYLTRRIVEGISEFIVKEIYCGNKSTLTYNCFTDLNGNFISNLDKNFFNNKILKKNFYLDNNFSSNNEYYNNSIEKKHLKKISLNTLKFCISGRSVCSTCLRFNLAKYRFMGFPIGTIGAQTVGEPGTQLTLRTFHMGGIFSTHSSKHKVNAQFLINLNRYNFNYTKIYGFKFLSFKLNSKYLFMDKYKLISDISGNNSSILFSTTNKTNYIINKNLLSSLNKLFTKLDKIREIYENFYKHSYMENYHLNSVILINKTNFSNWIFKHIKNTPIMQKKVYILKLKKEKLVSAKQLSTTNHLVNLNLPYGFSYYNMVNYEKASNFQIYLYKRSPISL